MIIKKDAFCTTVETPFFVKNLEEFDNQNIGVQKDHSWDGIKERFVSGWEIGAYCDQTMLINNLKLREINQKMIPILSLLLVFFFFFWEGRNMVQV